ncbi:MAG: histidine phosphatase family protein [Acidimicrobiales bacterium]
MAVGSVYVVRHGATEWSLSGRHTGRTDLPLVAAGRQQAAELGALLAGRSFALVLTSPLARARQTCALAGFDGEAEVTDDLAEWDYGEYEGMTSEEIRTQRPGWTLWADGVVGGEWAAEVGRRADRVVERARGTSGDTLCFSHGHLLRVLAARWLGLPPAAGRLLALDAGSLSVLGWEREAPVVESWNESPRQATG